MTDQPQPEHCDIENQCTHFCVYKGRYCPVYLRISRPRTPAPELSLTGDIKYYFDAGWEKGYEHGKAESARAATLAFIPLAEELASPSVSDARKREIIESLRRTAQEQQR